jgi:transposase
VSMTLAEHPIRTVVHDGRVGADKTEGPRADRPKRRTFTPEYKQAWPSTTR